MAFQGNAAPRPLLGTVNVIFVALGRTGSCPSKIMSVFCYSDEDSNSMPKRVKTNVPLVLSFSDRTNKEPYNHTMMLWWLRLEFVGMM